MDRIIKLTSKQEKKYTGLSNMNRICKRYEAIVLVALKEPENFQALSEQLEQMDNIRNTELPSLLVDLEAARVRLSYIASFSAITEDYMALNNIAFTWPMRIIPILEDHDKIINMSKGNCQEVLKERREKFEAELEDFQKQVDELQEVGDLDEMPFYVKKVLYFI
jgi:dynein heavy chain